MLFFVKTLSPHGFENNGNSLTYQILNFGRDKLQILIKYYQTMYMLKNYEKEKRVLKHCNQVPLCKQVAFLKGKTTL